MAFSLKAVLKKLSQFSLGLWVFTLPFQTNLPLAISSWHQAFPNPYLEPPLRIFDLFLLIATASFLLESKWKKEPLRIGHLPSLLLLLLFFLISLLSLFLFQAKASFLLAPLIQFSLLLLGYFLLVNKILTIERILQIFLSSLLLQVFLVFFQSLFQQNMGLILLGEPDFQGKGLAKLQLPGFDWIRPYGTFPHPNVLGTFLMTGLFFLPLVVPKKWQRIQNFALFSGLILSASRSNFLAFLSSFFVFKKNLQWKKTGLTLLGVLLAILVFRSLSTDQSISDRFTGLFQAGDFILQHPWGVGFLQSTNHYAETFQKALAPWEFQPIHNVLLLSIMEWGIPLALLFFILASFLLPEILKRSQLFLPLFLALMITSFFDHQLWTLNQGRELFLMVFALNSRLLCDPELLKDRPALA